MCAAQWPVDRSLLGNSHALKPRTVYLLSAMQDGASIGISIPVSKMWDTFFDYE
jgi:hypothetical protein